MCGPWCLLVVITAGLRHGNCNHFVIGLKLSSIMFECSVREYIWHVNHCQGLSDISICAAHCVALLAIAIAMHSMH